MAHRAMLPLRGAPAGPRPGPVGDPDGGIAAMTVPSEASARGRYRVVRPPERQDHSGQNLIRGFGISQTTAGSRHLSMAYGEVPIGATSERHYHRLISALIRAVAVHLARPG